MAASLIADLPSRLADASLRSPARIDPAYDGMFTTSSTAVWESAKTLRTKVRKGIASAHKVPLILRRDSTAAWSGKITPNGWQRRLDVLAAVTGWCTLTTEQIASVTGHSLPRVRSALADLFAMELVDCGLPLHPNLATHDAYGRIAMWRPGRDAKAMARFSSLLTTAERISITAGLDLNTSHQYDRHNVFTAEFALRLAEYAPTVATVFGDSFSSLPMLTALDGRSLSPAHRNMQADGTIVRSDGLRIAVETTINLDPRTFANKARNWASLLAQHPMKESGLVVLFLVVRRIDTRGASLTDTERRTRAGIRDAVLEYRGFPGDPTNARMFTARWDDFFPDAGLVDTDAFTSLRATRPTGNPGIGDDSRWEEADLLDRRSVRFAPADVFAPLAVAQNAKALRATPHWLRTGDRPQIDEAILTSAGFTTIPRLTGTVHGKARAHEAAVAGTATLARRPPRLEL